MIDSPLDKMNQSWQGFQEALDGITDEQIDEPGTIGEWSVKDVLAHLAFWDAETVSLIDLYTGAITRDDSDGDGEDWQQVNERVHDERESWTAERARTELESSHAAARARLQEALDAGHTFTDEQLAGNMWEHYDDHAADLRAYKERIAQAV